MIVVHYWELVDTIFMVRRRDCQALSFCCDCCVWH